IATLPALDIANAEGSRVNMAMLGAIAQACPFLSIEALEEAITHNLGKYPRMLPGNLKAFRRGYEEVVWSEPKQQAGTDSQPYVRPQPIYGYVTAPMGGTIMQPG